MSGLVFELEELKQALVHVVVSILSSNYHLGLIDRNVWLALIVDILDSFKLSADKKSIDSLVSLDNTCHSALSIFVEKGTGYLLIAVRHTPDNFLV